MKYSIEFQYAHNKDSRPGDEGYMFIKTHDGDGKQVIIPNVGDYVRIEHIDHLPAGQFIQGKVRSRYFIYTKFSEASESSCVVNIVVEETDDDMGMILKM
jgi:hypothetical protein